MGIGRGAIEGVANGGAGGGALDGDEAWCVGVATTGIDGGARGGGLVFEIDAGVLRVCGGGIHVALGFAIECAAIVATSWAEGLAFEFLVARVEFDLGDVSMRTCGGFVAQPAVGLGGGELDVCPLAAGGCGFDFAKGLKACGGRGIRAGDLAADEGLCAVFGGKEADVICEGELIGASLQNGGGGAGDTDFDL